MELNRSAANKTKGKSEEIPPLKETKGGDMISSELKRYSKKEVIKAICAARKWACRVWVPFAR